MSQDTSTPSPHPTATSEKQALLQAFDTVIKTAAEERELERLAAEARRRGRGTSRLLLLVCTAILVVVLAYLFVERPDWVFPTPAQPESAAVREASLRISVATAVQHVERYHQQTGRIPITLQQAGANGAAMHYERTADGYRVEGEVDGVRVSYGSGESLQRFIGRSFEVIARRSR
jgi:hypothetical protein